VAVAHSGETRGMMVWVVSKWCGGIVDRGGMSACVRMRVGKSQGRRVAFLVVVKLLQRSGADWGVSISHRQFPSSLQHIPS
jgi:hypothetical protein